MQPIRSLQNLTRIQVPSVSSRESSLQPSSNRHAANSCPTGTGALASQCIARGYRALKHLRPRVSLGSRT